MTYKEQTLLVLQDVKRLLDLRRELSPNMQDFQSFSKYTSIRQEVLARDTNPNEVMFVVYLQDALHLADHILTRRIGLPREIDGVTYHNFKEYKEQAYPFLDPPQPKLRENFLETPPGTFAWREHTMEKKAEGYGLQYEFSEMEGYDLGFAKDWGSGWYCIDGHPFHLYSIKPDFPRIITIYTEDPENHPIVQYIELIAEVDERGRIIYCPRCNNTGCIYCDPGRMFTVIPVE